MIAALASAQSVVARRAFAGAPPCARHKASDSTPPQISSTPDQPPADSCFAEPEAARQRDQQRRDAAHDRIAVRQVAQRGRRRRARRSSRCAPTPRRRCTARTPAPAARMRTASAARPPPCRRSATRAVSSSGSRPALMMTFHAACISAAPSTANVTPKVSSKGIRFADRVWGYYRCMRRTPLYDAHRAAGAKLVQFAGWEMPLHYGSQIEEHHAVRRDAGVFDTSHMLALDAEGAQAAPVPAPRARQRHRPPARAGQGALLVPARRGRRHPRRPDRLLHRRRALPDRAQCRDRAKRHRLARTLAARRRRRCAPRRDLAMLAVQGPRAREKCWAALPELRAASEALESFSSAQKRTNASSRAPATPARTVSSCCCPPREPPMPGSACSPPACGPAGSAHAIRCAWRPA